MPRKSKISVPLLHTTSKTRGGDLELMKAGGGHVQAGGGHVQAGGDDVTATGPSGPSGPSGPTAPSGDSQSTFTDIKEGVGSDMCTTSPPSDPEERTLWTQYCALPREGRSWAGWETYKARHREGGPNESEFSTEDPEQKIFDIYHKLSDMEKMIEILMMYVVDPSWKLSNLTNSELMKASAPTDFQCINDKVDQILDQTRSNYADPATTPAPEGMGGGGNRTRKIRRT